MKPDTLREFERMQQAFAAIGIAGSLDEKGLAFRYRGYDWRVEFSWKWNRHLRKSEPGYELLCDGKVNQRYEFSWLDLVRSFDPNRHK